MAKQPNIIIICADDLGYGDLGCFGSPNIRTPNLDALARDGAKFTSTYAEPICGPARAALMTGCYPVRVAEVGNFKHVHPILHDREVTMGEILKAAGYHTAMIGKWDLAGHSNDAFRPELLPGEQGFDLHFGTPTSNDTLEWTRLLRDGNVVEFPVNMATLTERYVDETITFLQEANSKPKFVYLAPNMPHVMLAASGRFRGVSKRGLYGDVVEELDFHIGRLIRAILRGSSDRDTILWFVSDNGPWIREKEDGGSPGPFRGGKATIWEGGMRIPAIVWRSSRIIPKRTLTGISSIMDILPTCAAWAGASLPEDRAIDGHDLTDYIEGRSQNSPRSEYFFYLRTGLLGVRQGKWKLHLLREKDPEWLSPFRPSQHVEPEDAGAIKTPLLFNIEEDYAEKFDRSGDYPDIVKKLLVRAAYARKALGDHDTVGSGARFFDPGVRPVAPQRK